METRMLWPMSMASSKFLIPGFLAAVFAVLIAPQPAHAEMSIGANAKLTLMGKTLEGLVGQGSCGGTSGKVFTPGAGQSIDLSLEKHELKLDKFCLLYGSGKVALGGKATLTLPSSNPLSGLIGSKTLEVDISGGPDSLHFTIDKKVELDLLQDGKPLKVSLTTLLAAPAGASR